MGDTVVALPVVVENQYLSWRKIGSIAACGTALFADGYVNNSIGPVNTIFKKYLYKKYMTTQKTQVLTAIAFLGTVLGMVSFGYFSDAVGRKSGMIVATIIIIIFSALSSGSYYKGDIDGMISMLTAWRFFTGIGIGAEYPTGSVAAAEQSEELPKRWQHGPFIMVTNFVLCLGSVCANMVPFILVLICTQEHLRLVWRLQLGLVIVPCLFVLPFRFILKQPQLYVNGAVKPKKIPYALVIRYYWLRLTAISIVWFIYDFVVFPFNLFSSFIVSQVLPSGAALWRVFGWNALITALGLPGSIIGALLADIIGPKKTFIIGLSLQIILGFIMAGAFSHLRHHIGGFVVVYGLFQSMGQMGAGNNLGLLASKSSATCVKGQFYGIAAAVGKIGAFAGTYAFQDLQAHWQDAKGNASSNLWYTAPFFLASALACVSLLLLIFLIKERTSDCQAAEDTEFKQYLAQHGYDLTEMGLDRSKLPEKDLEGLYATHDEKNGMVEESPGLASAGSPPFQPNDNVRI
ncbi:hypothetical protein MYAM1_002564 [Malassezia yamatoensis]|uniref:Major facilitator superfamily (MFS) profile domain-containing protein n=1 Tax=Malassezia yamatoensis TaxID=253288 RepID=A0AAJ5YV14_9BASI|nr:hypothetical protein MYAM1_002564 [Malassezia yamatoensis]